jgi:excisionase family DNA binding protein
MGGDNPMQVGPGPMEKDVPKSPKQADRVLTPSEAAYIFHVDPKMVIRWAAKGRIAGIRTPGGHRRFRESEVSRLL